jgi:hypothetical protein
MPQACDKAFVAGACGMCRRLNIQCLGISEDRYPWMRVSGHLARRIGCFFLCWVLNSMTFCGQDPTRLKTLTDNIKQWTSRRSNYELSAHRPPPLALEQHMMGDVQVGIGYHPPASSSSPQATLRGTMPYPPYQGASTNIIPATAASFTNSPDDGYDDDSQDEFDPFSEGLDEDAEGEPEDIESRVQQPASVVQMQPMMGARPVGQYPPLSPPPGTAAMVYNSPQAGYPSQPPQNYQHLSHPTTQYTQYYAYQQPLQSTSQSQLSAPTASAMTHASSLTVF